MPEWIDIFDLLLAPFYTLAIYLIALVIKNRKLSTGKNGHYIYFIPALFCKLIGGVSLCLVYTFYYKIGGDVTNYFLTAKTFVNVLFDGNFSLFFDMLDFHNNNIHLSGVLSNDYGQVHFRHTDYYALFTTTLCIPFVIIGCKSFIASTLLLAFISFLGLWKLFEVFVFHFPQITKQFAIAIFFIPSVFFWGSGLLKDTFAIFSIGIFTYGVFKFIIQKNRHIKYLALLIMSSFLLIFIKPYILAALMPGSLIWINFNRIQNIKSPILKTFAVPLLLIILVTTIGIAFSFLGNYLGEYSLDRVLDKAVKTQKDLVREQYGTNYYDIGSFDPSASGIISKAPAAINMALFRPYLWNANNPVMLLSGLENLFTLGFTIFILLKIKLKDLMRSLFSHPLLVFSLLFSLFFAFSVGLTTANYGALVRLKIPLVPFYISALFMLYEFNTKNKQTSRF